MMTDAAIRVFIIIIVGFIGYGYLLIDQIVSFINNNDKLRPLRVILAAIFLIAIVTLLPSFFYQVSVLFGNPDIHWQKISTYTLSINLIVTVSLIYCFKFYRIKEEENKDGKS